LLVEQTQTEQNREAKETPAHKPETDSIPLPMSAADGFRVAILW